MIFKNRPIWSHYPCEMCRQRRVGSSLTFVTYFASFCFDFFRRQRHHINRAKWVVSLYYAFRTWPRRGAPK